MNDRLQTWIDAGLIEPDQAQAIRDFEAAAGGQPDQPRPVRDDGSGAAPPVPGAQVPHGRVPLFGEALGYVGATLVAIAGGIVLAQQWDALRYPARLALVSVLLAVLVTAGAYLRNVIEPAAVRLVAFTWALSVAALAWLVGLIGGRDGLGLREARLALLVTVCSAAFAAVLWRVRTTWLQHVVLFVAIAATVVALLAQPVTVPEPFFFGVALVALSVVWLLVGAAGLLPPDPAWQWVGLLGALVGLRVLPSGGLIGLGLVLALVAAAVMLGAGVVTERPVLLGFGAASVFLTLPQAVFHFFGDTLGGPVALLLVGLVLIGIALLVVRVRADREAKESS